MIKSSTILKYIGQYGFLVGAISWIGGSAFDTVNGLLTGNWNTDEILARGAIGLIHLMAFLYFRNKFVVVELGMQKVKIIKDKETIETTWQNVESVNRFVFSSPPIYTIRVKDIEGYFIFWNSAINLLWYDDSELGELISQKKKMLDI
ncbi:MAG: hypothetical protein HOP30_14210 [Cyclobacteriaceae bacterium]|nr:hypothetical protein [Cyclobacteriaceae bacterium]